MDIAEVTKKAEQSGVTIARDKLIALLKGSNRKQYPIAKDARGGYIVVPITGTMAVRT